jgi:hypothetical protein
MTEYNIPASRVVIDNFGVWADSIQELAMMGHRVYGLYLGKEASDKKQFLNKRAELAWRCRERFKKWGMLVKQDWREELLNVFWRRKEGTNQIQIMDKQTMKRDYWIASPGCYDALSYTYLVPGWGEWPTMIPNFWLDPWAAPIVQNNFNNLI